MNVFKTIYKMIYPDRCPYCNCLVPSGKIVCETCRKVFPEVSFLNYASGGYPCFSPFLYQGIFATAVRRLKFQSNAQSAPALAVKITEAVINLNGGQKYDVITCVPMHKKKRSLRGYNQSELLARNCAKLLGVPYENLLEKVKDNLEQHKLDSVAKRRENVKGAYRVIDESRVKGRNILIIDDIITTGLTLGECCKVMRKKHAGIIHCAALCSRNN